MTYSFGIPTLATIQNKVRRITGRPSSSQITDAQINDYINTFYIYDMPEHLRLESLRVNYQFITTANIPVYDFPKEYYLTNMPPCYIAGYQTFISQERQNFFRINSQLNYMQQSVATGNGTAGPYAGTLINTPIVPGFKRNPPGAYTGLTTDTLPKNINWNVLVSGEGAPGAGGIAPTYTLIDDGMGNLVSVDDPNGIGVGYTILGSINYITGAVAGISFVDSTMAPAVIPAGNPINVQYIPYVASRPQTICFFQDQFLVYPIPDQAYTVSFEAYMYPTALMAQTDSPQLREWWQLLAFGAAQKIFEDNADFENMAKFRPLLDEQMRLVLRRTQQQYTSERTSTIYCEQTGYNQFPFNNGYTGI